MKTRIFKVEYGYEWKDVHCTGSRSFVAIDAFDAANKARLQLEEKDRLFIDINVTLEAEAD